MSGISVKFFAIKLKPPIKLRNVTNEFIIHVKIWRANFVVKYILMHKSINSDFLLYTRMNFLCLQKPFNKTQKLKSKKDLI